MELIKDAYATSNRAFNELDKGKLNSTIARDITFCTSLDSHAVGNQWGIFHGKKKTLTVSQKAGAKINTFFCELEYGANLDGYWTYKHMMIQLEDCQDILMAIYGDKYEYVFLFDHSCGHDHK